MGVDLGSPSSSLTLPHRSAVPCIDKAIEILGMEMATDLPSTFSEKSSIKMVGFDMTKTAASRLFEKTGLLNTRNIPLSSPPFLPLLASPFARLPTELLYPGLSPKDVDVVELHDCFSCNELITYEALGLCGVGWFW